MKHFLLELNDIVLVPLGKDHLNALNQQLVEEPDIWNYLMISEKTKDLHSFFRIMIDEQARGIAFPFVIKDKHSNQIIGSTSLYKFDRLKKTIMLGFTWIEKSFRGTMTNKISKYLLLEYAFSTLKVERVEFWAGTRNLVSINSMKSIGCTVEGILRNNGANAFGRRDTVVLSILKDEWQLALRNALFEKVCLDQNVESVL